MKKTNKAVKGAARPKARSDRSLEPRRKSAPGYELGFPIVGMGASAGGFDAFSKFFKAMPADSGMAFVLIQHLDPTKRSLAPELLAKSTAMRVAQVEDDPQIEPNCVYVIPPDRYLSISGGKLHLSEPDRPRGARMAVDFFLRSLAKEQEQRAVGVILSGTGTDGTLGIKAIKAAGGLVVAQDPATAEYDGMPRSAIATGAVDHILAPDEIPGVLVRYAQHPYVRERTVEVPAEREEEIPPDGLRAILTLVRSRTKRDFRSYKEKTLIRRTRRRMSLYHIDDYETYQKYLREHPEEVEALAKDLLITVTDFFRDPEAWEELQRLAIRPMVETKPSDTPIRIWTPGCATGEEPYSVSMLVLEELQRAGKICPLQVFASDIDKDALNFGRAGRYPKSIEADVSAERLKRFFTAVDGEDYYQVNKTLRDAVVFAEQNLIADPPFSKLDLVCCRNLLIYLKPEVQEKVIALLHLALREGGVLFLGSAETIGRQTDLFETLHKRSRIFRRVGPTRHDRVDIPLTTSGGRREIEATPAQHPLAGDHLMHLAQQRLLDLLAPSAVLIDRNWRVLYICGDVDPYLMHKPGVPTNNLLDNVRSGLRTKLRAALHAALSEKKTVTVESRVGRDSSSEPVTITVRPLRDREREQEDLALVVFAAKRGAGRGYGREEPSPLQPAAETGLDLDESDVARRLEQELADVKEDLQATIEQLEASNEEYKAANEEVTSVNEELQSTNEELETSKEELQSLNEELSTVNNQLAAKVEELETKHADLENLIAVTEVPTVCLDTDLMVRWFTPAANQVIPLKQADKGRPLADLAHNLTGDDLVPLARRVLESLTPVNDEVTSRDGRTFLRQVTPYRGDAHRIGGIVITFVDITRQKRDAQALRESEQRLASELAAMTRLHELVERLFVCSDLREALEEVLSATMPLMGTDMGTLQLLDRSARVLEIVCQRGFKQDFLDHFRTVTAADDAACGRALKGGGRVVIEDVQTDPFYEPHREIAASAGYRAVQSTPLLSRDGKVLGVLSTHYREPTRPSDRDLRILDLYARQAAEFIERHRRDEELKGLNQELEQRVAEQTRDVRRLVTLIDKSQDAIYTRTLDGTITSWNRAAEELYGYSAEEAIQKSHLMLVPPDLREEAEANQARLLRGEAVAPFETSRLHKDGRPVLVSIAISPVTDDAGQTVGIASVGRDIMERRRAEAKVLESDARLRAIFATVADGIVTIDHAATIADVNPAIERLFGYSREELIGHNVKMLMEPPDRDEHDGYVARYLRTGEAHILGVSREMTHRRRDGSTFLAELTVNHLPAFAQFVGVIHDVSERRRAEERERQHHAELARVMRIATAGELASGLAHQLNQPLAAIANNLQACLTRIRARKANDKSLLQPLQQASEEAQRAGGIVHSIREMVEKRPLRYEPIDLREPLRRAVRLLEGEVTRQGIDVQVDVAAEPMRVYADSVQIEQVVINLLQNAIDSIHSARNPDRKIRITASLAGGESAEIAVHDTGKGIGESDAANIFEPFFTTKEHGLGVGLALSRTIVEAHGGRMWFEHAADGGATFRFTLPMTGASKAATGLSEP